MAFRNILPAVCLCLLLTVLSTQAWSQHQFKSSGSSWGAIRYPSSTEEIEQDDVKLEGAITQDIGEYRFSPSTRIDYFVQLGFTLDSERIDYNNKTGIGPGLQLHHTFAGNSSVSLGAMYYLENHPVRNENYDGMRYFLNWWDGWQLPCASCGSQEGWALGFPGNTWGSLSYPSALTEEEDDNLKVEGSIEQGIDWLETEIGVLNSFVDFSYKADNRKLPWNNTIKLGAGIQIKKPLNETVSIRVGAKYETEYRWVSDYTWNDNLVVFVTWWASWDTLW